tara:strand:- start:3 stop:371 length:369 start_codon:yes stop_codon:yes gene_type:complete
LARVDFLEDGVPNFAIGDPKQQCDGVFAAQAGDASDAYFFWWKFKERYDMFAVACLVASNVTLQFFGHFSVHAGFGLVDHVCRPAIVCVVVVVVGASVGIVVTFFWYWGKHDVGRLQAWPAA